MPRHFRHAPLRAGLTLIELIVVLVILIGLAGIVIPMLPNMIGRTHTATAATTVTEVNKAVQTYEGLFNSYPDGWDALTNGSVVVDYLPGGSGKDLDDPVRLSTTAQTNLANAGITTLYKMVKQVDPTAGQTPTFNPYQGATNTPTPMNLSSDKVLVLSSSGIMRLGLSTTGTYVVLGLGKWNKMVGRSIAEPPTHFSDDPGNTPADVYARYGVIFKVADSLAPAMSRAVIAGVVDFGSDGIAGADAHIQEYYNIVKSTQ